jgi:beta-aspartyl-dipeptidase (metallo-type)
MAGGRIEALAEPGALELRGCPVEELDAGGKLIFPGLIDGHTHLLGGGGEGGPATRAPEIPATQVIPTHVGKNPELFEEAIRWAGAGG